jgi:hypothetical protein
MILKVTNTRPVGSLKLSLSLAPLSVCLVVTVEEEMGVLGSRQSNKIIFCNCIPQGDPSPGGSPRRDELELDFSWRSNVCNRDTQE